MLKAIQYIEECKTAQQAQGVLVGLRTLEDFLGGRVIEPPARGWWEVGTGPEPVWKVQAMFIGEDVVHGDWLPDGCRLVHVPPCVQAELGISVGVMA